MQHEQRWRDLFASGQRVRSCGPASIAVALPAATFVALGVLYEGVGTALARFTGRPVPVAEAVGDPYWWFVFVVGPPMLVLAACLWAAVLRPAIQFSETGFTFWDWRGRAHRIEYAEVVAISAGSVRSRTNRIDICRAGAEGASSKWMGMGVDKLRAHFSEAIIAELAWRCELAESDPQDARRDLVFLWRAGWRDRLPPIPWRVLLS